MSSWSAGKGDELASSELASVCPDIGHGQGSGAPAGGSRHVQAPLGLFLAAALLLAAACAWRVRTIG